VLNLRERAETGAELPRADAIETRMRCAGCASERSAEWVLVRGATFCSGECGQRARISRLEATLPDSQRRARLSELDDLLGELEQLNLQEAGGLPHPLKTRLLEAGVRVTSGAVTRAIDAVFHAQRKYVGSWAKPGAALR